MPMLSRQRRSTSVTNKVASLLDVGGAPLLLTWRGSAQDGSGHFAAAVSAIWHALETVATVTQANALDVKVTSCPSSQGGTAA